MIQNIFLPEKIGTYYLFSQRIAGIMITKTHIYATVVIARGSTITVEKSIVESLQTDKPNHTERAIEAIRTVMHQIGFVTKIFVALPGSAVVFKELRLPFDEYDKINKVVRFEVETLLPFAAQDAISDFIITDTNTQKKGSQVLVAATQKQTIAELLSLFEQAGVDPTNITVDTFCLYGLYRHIPSYTALSGTTVVMDIDIQSTRLMIIHNQQLRIIRTLPHGISQIAKRTGEVTGKTPQQIMDLLVRFGVEKLDPVELAQVFQTNLSEFFDKIQFALSSSVTQLNETKISKILITGPGADLKGMASFAHNTLQTPCEPFDITKLSENSRYKLNSKLTISQAGLVSAAAAIPSPITSRFNLRRDAFEHAGTSMLLKQLISAGVLVIILFTLLITHTVLQTRRLKQEIKTSEQETIDALKERFTEIPEDEDDLEQVKQDAENALKKEETLWRAFSSQTRASFLEYLLELSSRINKSELGFVPEQITILDGERGEITIKAKVRDYDALALLDKSLRKSKLLKPIEEQKTPEFTMKIMIVRNQ